MPAPEPAHAIRVAIDEATRAREAGEARTILFNLCGHGHFDLSAYDSYLSGAMQDYGRAHLVGETSAGCLAAAMIFPLADGSAMNITIQKIRSPKGHEINRIGVHPDEAVPPDPNSVADPQLQAAVNWAATQH